VKIFRTLPTGRLLALLAVSVAALVVGVAIAVGARSSGPIPPAEPLAQAVHDALAAPAPAGITARVSFTNNLLPSGALTGQAGSALITGASGRLWATNDGRGRIELQSDAGDVQIVWNQSLVTVYDASSNTAYRLTLPAQSSSSSTTTPTPPTLDEITQAITDASTYWAIGDAVPTDIAGQPAYDVTVSPKTSAGLLGSVELAWDAGHGVPLKLAISARGDSTPVLELDVTDISFGDVASSDVDVSPPAGATVVDVPTSGGNGGQQSTEVTGLGAVQAALPFQVAAPDTLGGLGRSEVRLVGSADHQGALIVYGEGLGAVAVFEHASVTQSSSSPLDNLPQASIGGAAGHELSTPLGTVVSWERGGVSFVLAGSVTASTAEADAAAVQ
jgi:outer membrane lipoprotein-sorting protein